MYTIYTEVVLRQPILGYPAGTFGTISRVQHPNKEQSLRYLLKVGREHIWVEPFQIGMVQ